MSESNLRQSMADHEHGLRFIDDEGRCLACSREVNLARIAELEAEQNKLMIERSHWYEKFASERERCAKVAKGYVLKLTGMNDWEQVDDSDIEEMADDLAATIKKDVSDAQADGIT